LEYTYNTIILILPKTTFTSFKQKISKYNLIIRNLLLPQNNHISTNTEEKEIKFNCSRKQMERVIRNQNCKET